MRRAGLTNREIEVLRLLAEGLTNKEIGVRLGISPLTAKEHLARISEHIGMQGRAGLVGWAFRNGWLR